MAAIDILSALNKTGSGINLKDLSAQLVEAATAAPKAAAQARIDSADLSISSLGTLRAQLTRFADGLTALQAADPLTVRSSLSAVGAKITDRSAVRPDTTQVGVLQLARAQVLEFGGFSSAEQALAAGTITLDVGVWYTAADGTEAFAPRPGATSYIVNVTEGMTLKQLAATMGQLDGLDAAIVDKGDGTFSLGLAGQTGAGNAVRLSVAEAVRGSGLAVFDTTTRNAEIQVQAAQNAVLTLNGVTLQRETNTVGDLVPGVELTLAATGGPASISVGRDAAQAQANVAALVAQLNDTRSLLSSLTTRATAGTKAGPMAGDSTLQQMSQQLDALLRAPIAGYGDKPRSLADFGVRTAQDGSLYLDTAVFTKIFTANPESIDALFADRLSGSGVEVSGLVPPGFLPGTYSFRRDATTGQATFDGRPLAGVDLGDGRTAFAATAGRAAGMILTAGSGVTEGTVGYGRSLVSLLGDLLSGATGRDGALATATTRYTRTAQEAEDSLAQVADRAAALRDIYAVRFSAMEAAVSRFHSTSNYLDSLVAQWNKNND